MVIPQPGNEEINVSAGQTMSMVGKVLVSLLWVGGGIAATVGGAPLVLIPVVLYMIYLWAFGGRWLIY
jgi:hypothetical protein